MYVRVRDPETGHEFDVPENSILLAKDLVKAVKADRYPLSPVVRPPKYRPLKLASRPAARDEPSTTVAADQPTEENHHG